MESLTIEILNPSVKKVLRALVEKNMINISEQIENEEVEEESWNVLTKEQQQGIFDALESIRSGKGIPHEQVMAKMRNKIINAQ